VWKVEGRIKSFLKKLDSLAPSHTKMMSQKSKISDFKDF
jgi:hypothetical protein